MRSTKVTSSEVARLAGVSQSAVSRVFTPGASVSENTVKKVRMAADELGYRPNVLARAMVSGKSRMIGLVVAYLNNQFYPEALERLSNVLQQRGYHVLVFMTSTTAGNVDRVIEDLLDYQVDGIIAASVALSSELSESCLSAKVPLVMFNRAQDNPHLSAITSANASGGRKVARFFLAGGYRKVGYIAGWEGASTQRDREAGFVDELERAGVGLYSREVGNFVTEEAQAAARRMFRSDPPDAIFVANDHMAFAVMDTLRYELGMDLPGDVSIIGYDDVPAAAWPSYNLTTVRQPVNRLVAHTVDILLDNIENPDVKPQRIEIDGPLVIRNTARVPREETIHEFR
ncbi:MAG: LacI family DNA-binding transcriptional regulator [Aestuariivita sp.]|nr:LacI family DNA-binding transcriptional regulator [Aestuariivita sp.]